MKTSSEVRGRTSCHTLGGGLSDTDVQLPDKARDRSHSIAEALRENGGSFMGVKRVHRQPPHCSPILARRGEGFARPSLARTSGPVSKRPSATRSSGRHTGAHVFDSKRANGMLSFLVGAYLMVQRFGVAAAKS